MTLGQRIYNLRMAKGLSQEAVAEQLDVSRQSVSKWETDTSVPDLDKLVKLCDLFGVSMDELVRGEVPKAEAHEGPQVTVREVRVRTPTRVIMGAVLLIVGVLAVLLITLASGGALEALLFGLPIVFCGVICLMVKKHPGVWCAWLLFLIACVYTPAMMGVNYVPFVLLVIAIIVTAVTLNRRKKTDETTL